jgi:glucosylceramidase
MEKKLIQWVSTTKEAYWNQQEVVQTAAGPANLSLTNQTGRIIEGFGGCFNELGFTALENLPEEERSKVYDELFSPDGACKFTICRLPIGASDYALEWYSHNEVDNDFTMEYFNIDRDRKYLIPYIKEALKRNPDMKLFASPWSPPTWMKFPKAYNYGKLRWEKEILEAYALYFVKFIEAYEQEGIKIHQIHVQNEVVADQKFPSCVWSGEELQEFIRDYLGPAFEKHNIETEIWLGTINGIVNELFQKSASDYDQMANVVLSDPEAKKYIKGVGYHPTNGTKLSRTTVYADRK